MNKAKTVSFYIIFILLLAFLVAPIYGKDSIPKLAIRQAIYRGNPMFNVQMINQAVRNEIQKRSIVDIIESEKDADYLLTVIFEALGDFKIEMDIIGLTSKKENASITKRTTKEKLVGLLIEDAVDYIAYAIFPAQSYIEENDQILTETEMARTQGDDSIDRERKTARETNIQLFTPIQDNLFKDHIFQMELIGSLTVPLEFDLFKPSLSFQLDIPFHFYFFSMQFLTLSVFVDGTFTSLSNKVSANQSQNLYVIGAGGGLGLAFTIPAFKQINFHLNLGGGRAASFYTNDLTGMALHPSSDWYLHPFLDIEYLLTEQFSVSLACSYLWIMYSNDNYQTIEAGIGLAYRF
jgi:hypothetical protein